MTEIDSIIEQMTLEEKASICAGASNWTTVAFERLGVPALRMYDGPHGLRFIPDLNSSSGESLPATSFPTASCMASTWDVDLLHQVGQALGEECIAMGVDVLLGPGVNMKRTPLCGRNFEYYSEDPYLAGEMAASYINGVQSKGVGTSLKHYACNNQEFQRFSINASMDERTLREIYLPAFEAAVKKAKPWTVMCAYNKINGTYCSENHHLLVDILKNEWGFEGLVVSDWTAVHDRVAALRGGLDLEMPGPRPQRVRAVIEAVRTGTLDEAMLNDSVHRILTIVFKAASSAGSRQSAIRNPQCASEGAHHELARKVAAEGMVLLKNNGILPLRTPQRIAVIGRAAKIPYIQGGGSSHVNPANVAIPFHELEREATGAQFTYADGYVAAGRTMPEREQELIYQAVEAACAADVALLFIALPPYKESEGYDRADIDFTPHQVELIQSVSAVQPNTVVILNSGSAVAMDEWIDAPAAVLQAWMMGEAGGEALADVLFGRVNPSGKLAETFPRKLSDTPAYINYPGEDGTVRYGEGIFIGYRYYDARQMPVLFPFGYGGSYTTFEYSAPRVSSTTFKDADGITVSVDVTNTGEMAGKEVVQVYVHQRKSLLARPPKELKGFAKVELQPGETTTVTIPLDFRAFACYHPAYGEWIAEEGEYDILIGASSADIRCTATVTLQSTAELPCILHRESTVREWLQDPRGKAILEPMFGKFLDWAKSDFVIGEAALDETNTDLMGMLDMPLLSILEPQESTLDMPAEELIDKLLADVHGRVPAPSIR